MLGVDVGGANLKIHDGHTTRTIYAPLWREEGRRTLRDELSGAGDVAAVLTGELADAYPTRRHGVLALLDALETTGGDLRVYGYDGFASPEQVRRNPLNFAGANWPASAALLENEIGECVLVDTGTTTTDVIPVPGCTSTSDLERLRKQELVYSGAVRTDLSALLDTVDLRGKTVPVARERFALTGDAHLLLENIDPNDYAETPDDGPATPDGAQRRIARLLCTDTDELTDEETRSIAEQAFEKQVAEMRDAVEIQADRTGTDTAAVCGLGSFLAREAAERAGLDVLDLSLLFGEAAEALPAYAVRELALREL